MYYSLFNIYFLLATRSLLLRLQPEVSLVFSYYLPLHSMGISLECYRAAIGLFNINSHDAIRCYLVHVLVRFILNLAEVFALMAAFCLLIISLSSDIHTNPGPTSSTILSIAHLNVRSLLSHDKLDHITALLDIHHFDIFALSETWLSSYELEEISIDGYHLPLIKTAL